SLAQHQGYGFDSWESHTHTGNVYLKTPCRRSLVCPNPGSFFTHINFLNRVHMNPANPIDSAVVHPPRLLVALWCYRQLKKTEKKTGACYESNRHIYVYDQSNI